VHRVGVIVISTLLTVASTFVAFAGCCESVAPGAYAAGCRSCGPVIYSPYTGRAIYFRSRGQSNDTALRLYYDHPGFQTPSELGMEPYFRPSEVTSRIYRHKVKKSVELYNRHADRRIFRRFKLTTISKLPVRNVTAASTRRGAATLFSNASNKRPPNASLLMATPVPEVVEVARERVQIISADTINALHPGSYAPTLPMLAEFKRNDRDETDIKQADAELTKIKQIDAAVDSAAVAKPEQSGLAVSKRPSLLAKALVTIAGALAAMWTAWFLLLSSHVRKAFGKTQRRGIRSPISTATVTLRPSHYLSPESPTG
jgi:hypothetical protein